MDMNGEYQIAAPRQRVWEALNDPEVLRQCIPGCEEIVKLSDVEWTAKVTAKVGPVKAKFGGKVTLSDLDPPNGYTITGEGTGGAAGFAKGGAAVKLTDHNTGTLLAYTVKAQVGGKLAQIGSRLIDGASRKMADEFFAAFAARLNAPSPATPAEPAGEPSAEPTIVPAPASTATSAPSTPAEQRGARLPPLVWVVGLVVALVAVLLVFTR